jgi:mono/diheme cytochrome c family protein
LSTEAIHRTHRTRILLGVALAAAMVAGGCRQNMHNQHKVEPFEQSEFFADQQGTRPIPEGTVARGGFGEKIAPYTGLTVSVLPGGGTQAPPMTPALVRRGQERYNIFCSPCHGRLGDGRGMIVRRGYKQPTSFHDARLRGVDADYFVTVITQGFGVMPSYAPQVPLEDRWAIAAYVRALQYSQNARLADLPDDVRGRVEAELRSPAAGLPAAGGDAGGHGVTRPGDVEQHDQRPAPGAVSGEQPGEQ